MPSNPLVSVLLNMAANSKKRNKDMTTEATPVPTELDNPLDASHNARDGKPCISLEGADFANVITSFKLTK